jgi:energy-coupling factor transport system ATP-binding protein
MEPTQICIRGVTYQYPQQETPTLHDLSLTVRPSEVLAIMGPTGAGKTTLVSLLNGLIPQHFEGNFSGQVWVGELSTTATRIPELVERVGLVLQDAETQIFGITVLEDTAFGPSNLGYPRERIEPLVREALSAVRLSGYEQRLTKQLSGGEKQRLAIAGVLAMQPDVLVLDEPTAELDPLGSVEVLDAVATLQAQNGTTVVLVDHNAEDVLRLADRVAVIIAGRLAWLGEPRELFRNLALTRLFAIRPPQMADLGKKLLDAGLISGEEIPLHLEEAETLVRRLLDGKKMCAQPLPSARPVQGQPVIQMRDLRHSYPGGMEALAGISLDIYPGELVAIIGQNGAGKSTLVKHLNGLLLPSSGTVKINGADTRVMRVEQLARQVGYVFQNPDHQIFCASVEEEIRFGLKNLGLSASEQEERIAEALEFVGLQEKRTLHPFTLGKGERQKVAVASILAIAPPVICIDEPTTGLDWSGAQRMMELIGELHRQGHTIVMITHQMELVADWAQRVLLLHQGRLLLDGSPAQVFQEAELMRQRAVMPTPLSQLVRRLVDLGCPQTIHTTQQLVQAISSAIKG